MNERELRTKYVSTAQQYLGCKESDGSHKKIIDLYNTQKPLPRGYKLKYTDDWCAGFVTAVGIKAGLSDIILPECSCGEMVALYQKAGRWKEDDNYKPTMGDIIMYDWQDTGAGDNKGWPRHVGIVTDVTNNVISVIEGNKGDAVAYRTLSVGGKYIRGYCLPDYGKMAQSDARAVVKAKAGLEEATLDYIEAYKYGKELMEKLAKAMKGR